MKTKMKSLFPEFKKKWWLLLAGALLFLCVSPFFIFSRPGVTDCIVFDCPPRRNLVLLDLDIPSTFFPEKEFVGPFHRIHESSGAFEDGIKTIYWHEGDGLAIYIVERFRKPQDAEERANLHWSNLANDLANPTSFSLSKSTADLVLYTCGAYVHGGYRCVFIAQYDEYCVFFNSFIDDKMTFLEYRDIVFFIDQQMADSLAG
jgi:hypothetical protein